MKALPESKLMQMAAKAAQKAYAPYSDFQVGAALLTNQGQVFIGVNVENASYGLTICAERVALGAAIAAGHREFQALALALRGGGTPCGACRQVLNEFAPRLPIIIGDLDGQILKKTNLDLLLPEAFGPNNLT